MKCNCCGRFFEASPRAMWQMVYSGFPQAPDREIHRCETCVDRFGELQPQMGIVPEFSVGFLRLGSRLATALKESAP
jgi:hypothetical protein